MSGSTPTILADCICCHGSQLIRLDYRDQFFKRPLAQCISCGHIQVEVVPASDDIRAFYAKQYSSARHEFVRSMYLNIMRRRARAQLDSCERFKPLRGMSVLDVGCGYGALVAEAVRRGASASGVEFDPQAATYCREASLDVALVEDEQAVGIRIRQQQPEIVMLSHTLEHLRSPQDLLSACTGSLVFIEVPLYDANIPEQFVDQEGHLNFFTVHSLKSLLIRLGFRTLMLGAFGPNADLFWRDNRRWKRELIRMVTRDYFFRAYHNTCARGIWLRALAAKSG